MSALALAANFTIVDAPQRSAEWFAARLGRLTGSRAGDMLATLKRGGGEAAPRRDLRLQLALERITGRTQDDAFVTADMRRAVALEPAALDAYEALTGYIVSRTGFLSHDSLPVGCSLDGHVGAFAGILEIKCPKSATHFSYLQADTVPAEYVPQLVHNLWISGAAWCDFLSFDDRFPPALQTRLIRYPRNEQEIASYALAAGLFLSEVGDTVTTVQKMEAAA